MKKDTKLAQFGRKVGYEPKTVNVPLHRASTVLFDSLAQMRTVQTAWDADEQVSTYGVFNMPQELALANAATELEGGYRAATFSSGLAAITGALLACVKAGDHVLMTNSGYAPGRFFATSVAHSLETKRPPFLSFATNVTTIFTTRRLLSAFTKKHSPPT